MLESLEDVDLALITYYIIIDKLLMLFISCYFLIFIEIMIIKNKKKENEKNFKNRLSY